MLYHETDKHYTQNTREKVMENAKENGHPL